MRYRTNSSSVGGRPSSSSIALRDRARFSSGRWESGLDSRRSAATRSFQSSPNTLRYTQSFGQPNGRGPYLPRRRFFRSSVAPA